MIQDEQSRVVCFCPKTAINFEGDFHLDKERGVEKNTRKVIKNGSRVAGSILYLSCMLVVVAIVVFWTAVMASNLEEQHHRSTTINEKTTCSRRLHLHLPPLHSSSISSAARAETSSIMERRGVCVSASSTGRQTVTDRLSGFSTLPPWLQRPTLPSHCSETPLNSNCLLKCHAIQY